MSLAQFDTSPDSVDLTIIVTYLVLVVGGTVTGYVLMAIDIRQHYRRFNRALVCISQYTRRLPQWLAKQEWADRHTPACFRAFGLKLPTTQQELLDAYRRRVKELHPDHGGDREQFLQLQRCFEEARSLLEADE